MHRFLSEKTYFAALCLIMLSGILVAGLAPFGSPVNGVERLRGENGLAWNGYSIAVSAAPLVSHPPKNPSFSIELRLRPAEVDKTRTLLSFYNRQHPRWFQLRQSEAGADLESVEGDDITFVDTKNFFQAGQLTHLAVTSSPGGTKFYVNGELLANHAGAEISSRILTGTLTLGNSATEHDSWQGEFLGLAIFNRELTAAQLQRHLQTWNYRGCPEIESGEHPVALYLFDEASGRILQNRVAPEAPLNIPEKYELSKPAFLALPWREFRAEWSYARDVIINLAGFVPFGFALRSYFSLTAARSWAASIAMISGTAVSLLIELTQSHLPTRDSSYTDVITNSLGNWAGAMIAGQYSARR